jgi:hypothetical protein
MSKQQLSKKPEKSRRRIWFMLSAIAIGCAFLLKRDSQLPKK